MTDIVEQLRNPEGDTQPVYVLRLKAADEIERLRATIHELEKQIALDSIGWDG